MKVILYSDGSSRGNPGPGGFGTVLHFTDSNGKLHTRELSQGYTRTTNNRMELLGVITGLEALKRPCTVEVHSDSQYVVNAFNQHWVEGWLKRGWKNSKKEPVKNSDLWKRLLEAKKPHNVSFHWVKAMQAILKTSAVTNWQPRQPMAPAKSRTKAFRENRNKLLIS